MGIFYHLSHFFEFLTSLYFGGIALLGFFQKNATNTLSLLIRNRKVAALNAKTQVREYFKVAITGQSGPLSALVHSSKWALWESGQKFVDKRFTFANNYITTLATEKGLFLKKFFPSFFYSGFYCLSIVLFSGFVEVSKNENCIREIDLFFLYYSISSTLFQIWAIFIFPKLVNRHDYLKLILLNMGVCFLLTVISTILTCFFKEPPVLANLLLPASTDRLVLYVLTIAIIPLISVFIFATIVLLCWIGSNSFYMFTIKRMNNSNDISGDIQELTNPKTESVIVMV
jgi:hypothetical protein